MPTGPGPAPCPRCGIAFQLRDGAGALGEAMCERCMGRFLDEPTADGIFERLLLDREMVKELAATYAGAPVGCPSCRSRAAPVRLKGCLVYLCRGCGGLWVDKGDFTAITEGQFREVGVTDRPIDEVGVALPPPPPPPIRQVAPGYRWVRRALGAGLFATAAVSMLLERGAGSPAFQATINALVASGLYVLFFTPTVLARRKAAFKKLAGLNLLSVVLWPLWPVVLYFSIAGRDLLQAIHEGARPRSPRRLRAAPAPVDVERSPSLGASEPAPRSHTPPDAASA